MEAFALLANIVLFVHFGYVTFTVGGQIVILLGGLFHWRWVRNLIFRLLHAASVVLVAVEAVLGISCPLTVWEYHLRILAGEQVGTGIPFVARLVRSIIFYNFPSWVFLVAYVSFALFVGATFLLVKPEIHRSRPVTGARRASEAR